MLLWLSIILLFVAVSASHDSRPFITPSCGKIRGHYKKSFNNRTFSAFEGIPYAKPPIGERRFKEPEPIQSWAGIREAVTLYECVQILDRKVWGVEDCLYINVYVPRAVPNPHEKLDVIVHIHGGAFMYGSAQFYAFPEYLMDRDVIFVTFNYRLGVFGFLSTEDEVLPGNNGMRDQVLALKWIQKNIGAFGGNAGSVTITGASAGAGSVHLHYMSPMSRGLFHKGVSTSGCALNSWSIQRGALTKAQILASNVGCPYHNSRALMECLKTKSSDEIMDKVKLLYGYKQYPVPLFVPIVEKGSPKPFLDKEPYDLLVARQFQPLPWVVSSVLQEGEGMVFDLKDNIEDLNKMWKILAPIILEYNCTALKERCESVSKRIKDFYLGTNQDLSLQNFDKFYKMFTDRFINYGTVKAASLQSAVPNAPVYYYQFSYTGDTKNVVGHADDLQYFFNNNTEKSPTQNELKMKDVMINMLVDYAKTGKPALEGTVGKRVQPNQLNFVNISGFRPEDVKSQVDRNLGSGDFWDSLGLVEFGNRT